MDLVSEVFLPFGDVAFELPDLPHEILETRIHLYFDGAVGDPLHPLLDEAEYLNLLIFI